MESIAKKTVNLLIFVSRHCFTCITLEGSLLELHVVSCALEAMSLHVFGVSGEVWIFCRSYWGHGVDLCPQPRCRKMHRGERKQAPGWTGLGLDLIGLCTSLVNRQLIGSFKPTLSFWPQ